MWLDKRTYVLASAAVIAAAVLGWLSGVLPGAFAGVLAAFAGLVPAILWEATRDRRDKLKSRGELLANAQREFVPPQILQGGVARYLRPEEAVVDFRPRPELDDVKDWLASDRPADICLVTGEGGTGKTRLALQLAEDASAEYGFNCYWVKAGEEEQAASAAGAGKIPALLIVDYAETRGQLAALLDAVIQGWSGPNVRVLVLARSAGEWWEQLAAGSDYLLSETLATVPVITLGPLSAPSDQADVFHQALKAFSTEMQAGLPPTVSPPPLNPDAVALVVHAAALLTVLNDHLPRPEDHVTGDPAQVISGLLRHEARYWEQSQASYQVNLGPAITRRVVAAGTLIGADDETSAVRLLAAIDDLADQTLRGKVARWLHDLYPSGAPGTEDSEWICPLRPDLLAEKLVTDVLQSQQQLIPALFAGLNGRRSVSALTVLGRAALNDSAAADVIRTAVGSDPDNLIVPAMTVAVETNRSIGPHIADVLRHCELGHELLTQIAATLPSDSIALVETALIAYQALAEASSADQVEHSRYLLELSTWLSRNGRREEALDAITQAVTTYRHLAAARPDAFLPDLAVSLNNQSADLADLGRREEALDAITQAVTIRRDLAAARPDAFLPDLATSLNNQSVHLAALGRREEALDAITQAVTTYRDLAQALPVVFAPSLKSSLTTMAELLELTGKTSDAEKARNEAKQYG